jgi:hypothetical protein
MPLCPSDKDGNKKESGMMVIIVVVVIGKKLLTQFSCPYPIAFANASGRGEQTPSGATTTTTFEHCIIPYH